MEVFEVVKLLMFAAFEGFHIIFNSVKPTKYEVEYQDVETEPGRQLANHSWERAADFPKHIIAESNILCASVDLILHAVAFFV